MAQQLFSTTNSMLQVAKNPKQTVAIGTGSQIFAFYVTGVKVHQYMDVQVQRSMDGDLALLIFGKSPVRITLQSVQDGSKNATKQNGVSDIKAFYQKYRAQQNQTTQKMLTITIGNKNSKVTYKGVLLSKDIDNQPKYPGILIYTMVFMGVQISNG